MTFRVTNQPMSSFPGLAVTAGAIAVGRRGVTSDERDAACDRRGEREK